MCYPYFVLFYFYFANFSPEIKWMQQSLYGRALIFAEAVSSPQIIALVTFGTFVLAGGELTLKKALISLGLYYAMRVTWTIFIPFAIQFMSESMVSISRLKVYMLKMFSVLLLLFVIEHSLFVVLVSFISLSCSLLL